MIYEVEDRYVRKLNFVENKGSSEVVYRTYIDSYAVPLLKKRVNELREVVANDATIITDSSALFQKYNQSYILEAVDIPKFMQDSRLIPYKIDSTEHADIKYSIMKNVNAQSDK